MQFSRTKEDQFTAYLKSMHLRKTPERYEILHTVMRTNGHFDVDSLYTMLDKKSYHVSRATLYSTLELLCNCGIVRKLKFDTHQAKYELAEETHSHLICTKCGEIRETDLEEFPGNLNNLKFKNFTPAYTSICIYGLCEKCREKINK